MSDIIIYGRGKTGQSLYKMVTEQGKNAVFYDDKSGFDGNGEFGRNSLVLLSPGVKPYALGIAEAKKCGANILSELEYCFPYCKGKCVSVTGTNGKTTTCEMIYHILKKVGKPCRLLGNGGVPFSAEVLRTQKDETVILESSSFQLTGAETFAPYISVFTNAARDHLDYHASYEEYISAKVNNFKHQISGYAIFNADDLEVCALSNQCRCRKVFYSVNKRNANCFFENGNVVLNIGGKSQKVKAEILQSYVNHNLSNALAAITAVCLLGVPLVSAVEILQSYKFLPHRMEVAASYENVTFIDDSKATNVHATVSALRNYSQNLALILGGSDKGENFDDIFTNAGGNVRTIAACGETADKIVLCGAEHGAEVKKFDDIKQATEYCFDVLSSLDGGIVLMSNACASFDKFNGYAERGDYFQKIVEDLICAKKTN